MGKPKITTNTRASCPTPKRTSIIKKKEFKFKSKSKSKSNDMTSPKFRKELIEKLKYEKMKQKFEETSV